jgi:hypothetical protein
MVRTSIVCFNGMPASIEETAPFRQAAKNASPNRSLFDLGSWGTEAYSGHAPPVRAA